jgi:glycosyltransferase involved in cell wall biosynthesis
LKKLLIISHTDHQYDEQGTVLGWGPTINEINFLSKYWDEVVHIACLDELKPKGTSLPYLNKNIRLVPIKPFGGGTLVKKLLMLKDAFNVLSSIKYELVNASHVQIRVPMGIGNYLLPFFYFYSKKRLFILWVKYANNWVQNNPPMGYRFQRWFLKSNFLQCKVTINGIWESQEKHCISFENPCLTVNQVNNEKKSILTKDYKPPFKFLFVGRLEDDKGVLRIINAFKNIPQAHVESITFIGTGSKNDFYINKSLELPHQTYFLGALSQFKVHDFMKESHFLLLPTTASEGFPKVIAEASCYGCIPIVTDLASIGQYVTNKVNGFLFDENNIVDNFSFTLKSVLGESDLKLNKIAMEANAMSLKFSFESYFEKLKTKIFI